MIQQTIQARLTQRFEPDVLAVDNESHQHNVPPGSESHFKVTIVAPSFDGLRKVRRHQAIYAELQDLLDGPVHALALHVYTPEEWEALDEVPGSPKCLGGSGK